MTTKARKEFDREFKLGAVALVAEGRPMTLVAKSRDALAEGVPRLPSGSFAERRRRAHYC